KEFHDAGLKVVMDVVYNHTHNVGPQGSTYDAMVPRYYYRLTSDGSYANGSGVGNEVASEKAMARRFIEQSCRYWVEEYHVDGFRFDLMGLIDTETMTRITEQVKAINPHAIVYGEPWGGYGGQILTGKGDQRGLGFGVFNDNIRNAIRGSTDGTDGGFAMGDGNDKAAVIRGIEGSINDFADHASETLNYISAHDNYTWWDKLDYRWNPNETPPPHQPEAELRKMAKLGLSVVMTAQGIPFLHAGSEFLRTKRTGDPLQTEESIRNSYASGDDVNELDWQLRVDNDDMVQYVKGLITLRKARYEFRLGAADSITAALDFIDGLPTTGIAYTIGDVTPGDDWGDILVAHNSGHQALAIDLPGGHWAQVVDGEQAGTDVLTTVVSSAIAPAQLSVPARTTAVLYQQAQPGIQLNLFQNIALDAYLQVAVNAPGGAGAVALTINGSSVPLTSQATGTWTGSYQMSTAGNLDITLQAQDVFLTRTLVAGNLASQDEVVTHDGRAHLLLPRNKATGWVVAADQAGLPSLAADSWLFGATGAPLPGARIQIATDRADVIIERRDGQSWTSLPTIQGEGFVTADTDHLGMFRLAPGQVLPQVTRLLGNVPNPFNPSTEIRFELSVRDAAAPVRLGVYDVRGRLVRTLHHGPLSAGPQGIVWDGLDHQGTQVASGVYFYQLSTAGRARTGRMLLIK
nr:FlgD immunoglobulin-like domain containing protein [Candidatus Krumholzibacteria bacterium]